MAIENEVSAQELTQALVAAVRDDPATQRLWMIPRNGYVEFWLLTVPSDTLKETHRLYEAARVLYDQFENPLFDLHIVDPSDYEVWDIEEVIPQGAEEVPLHPEQ